MNQMKQLHDWTLISVTYEWETAEVLVRLKKAPGVEVLLRAHGVLSFRLSHSNPWGPSESVNWLSGPTSFGNDLKEIVIEMQSGDTISVIAKSYDIPT